MTMKTRARAILAALVAVLVMASPSAPAASALDVTPDEVDATFASSPSTDTGLALMDPLVPKGDDGLYETQAGTNTWAWHMPESDKNYITVCRHKNGTGCWSVMRGDRSNGDVDSVQIKSYNGACDTYVNSRKRSPGILATKWWLDIWIDIRC